MNSEFAAAMHSAGVEPPCELIADGKLRRFTVAGDRPKSLSGWYVLHGSPACGAFGCWKRGISQSWNANNFRNLSSNEKDHYRMLMKTMTNQREQEQGHCRAAAEELLAASCKAGEAHPYLVKKSIRPHRISQHNGRLVIPVRGNDQILRGVQFIDPGGKKWFMPNTMVSGGYFSIGRPKDQTILICEGYATGASLHESTGHAVAVAFHAGNLQLVAKALREKHPNIRLILCADDDFMTEGNPGLTKATDAARSVGGMLAVPEFSKERQRKDTDFNDMAAISGKDAVSRCVENARSVSSLGDRPENKAKSEGDLLEVLRADQVKIEPISWLWPDWLAAGKFHLLAGAPGTGKTTLALALAAILTNGGNWPDGTTAPSVEVAIWSGEDDPADTLVPRLLAAGANRARVHIIRGVNIEGQKRPFDPARDMTILSSFMQARPEIKLLIVDPVVSAVAGDSHKNTEVRRNLQPLVDLAAERGCALLGISHFTKGTSGRDPLERITGSLAFGALARIVFAAAKLSNDEDGKRLFARVKSNIGTDSGGWHYQLNMVEIEEVSGIFTSQVAWCGQVEGSARDLLNAAEMQEGGEELGALAEAKEFLRTILNDGPEAAKKILSEAKQNGISEKTVRRAKNALQIVAQKTGMGGAWFWSLPQRRPTAPEDAQQKTLATFTKAWPSSEHALPEFDF